ncbi:AraC family transcriptional regulator [Burkholderia alba]|uniref:AraC family transcriptional regulator n=1 Tax=Burkholderia alba TaxID=2683677 RepID=UPI002B057E8F|nr:helix-turn-helix transcriptional regulator [Burkholderia alba]
MTTPLILPARSQSRDGPVVHAVRIAGPDIRVTRAHRHARGQLFGALAGLLSIGAACGEWVVPATHAVWIPPDVPHSMRSHGPFSGWAVYVTPGACAALPAEPCALAMPALLRAAVERAASWPGGTLDAAQDRVAAVILDEIAAAPREPLGLPLPHDPRLRRIARALADHPADNRTLDAWAQWAAIAPRTLTRRFVAETGFSFTAWRQRARLLRALEMLAAGLPVTRIALDLGYDNVSAFIAMFRRQLGATPARYRDDARPG